MKIDLNRIEEKLKDFFENDLKIVTSKNPLQNLTNQVIAAMEKNLKEVNGQVFSPNIFRISLRDKNLIGESDLIEWKRYVQDIIKEITRDNSFQQSGPLHIQIFINTKLIDNFEVAVSHSSIQSGKTVSLFSEAKTEKGSESILGGYLITSDDTYYFIKKAITTIGRREDNDLIIDNLRVSRVHAQIRQINHKHVIFDLDSTSGTKVNGIKVRQHNLKHGDVIEIADVPLIYGNNMDDVHVEEEKSKTRMLTPEKRLKSKK